MNCYCTISVIRFSKHCDAISICMRSYNIPCKQCYIILSHWSDAWLFLIIMAFVNQNFILPIIRHGFAEQLIQYNLVRTINDDVESVGIMDVVFTQSFCAFKSNIKTKNNFYIFRKVCYSIL